ncbi:DNA topoisomerase I [candidate division KSB1 bacterium]|nr:DNA topoisomerase I [candidate division KSB1 bacterium]
MNKNLVIVESPAKARTINKYLGNNFEVLASYGHVRDLIPKDGAIDLDTFTMNYTLIDKNKKHVNEIIKAFKTADALFLATDPDREGEAISWHLTEILANKNLLKNKPVKRIVFHEITQSAIKDALAHPRDVSMELVNAQQARRALDYLVGFNLSPLLWKKIKYGLSAGRVQSPALRMIVEREVEIEAFTPQEFWSIEADCLHHNQAFTGKLIQFENKKVEQFTVVDEKSAAEIRDKLLQVANGHLKVVKVEKKQRKRRPAAPFITSTLQQEASRKLGFSASRTMRIAQQLYEGVDVGGGAVGLITYMRTDSVNLAAEAVAEIRSFVQKRYGSDKVPAKPNVYQTKQKNAQEAHEAIRPTSVNRVPDEIRNALTQDQFKLYNIIWKRTVASQMVDAIIDTVAVDLECGKGSLFRANGSHIRKPGFMAVYLEGTDDVANGNGGDENMLPPLKEGEDVQLTGIRSEQHFTKPPARYTEASLIKALEEYGIGRPSTYAQIITTLLSREYVILDSKRFFPTDVGRVVHRFLKDHFEKYVDYEFTADLEDELDAVSRGEEDWIGLMRSFWGPFSAQVNEKTSMARDELIEDRVLGVDTKSGRPVSVRMGRYGPLVQIGTKDDEEKPRFASLTPNLSIETITLQEALALFELPRQLGTTAEGEPVSVNIGRYGPYVRYGNKFASIKADDPYSISLDRALEIIEEKKREDANKVIQQFAGSNVQVLNGRYGPYITDGSKNARIPKNIEPESLTLEECLLYLEKAPAKKGRGRRTTTKK